MRVAAIDIGSNSVRLLVAESGEAPAGHRLKALARAGEPCRLGRGLDRSGMIEEEMAERAARLALAFVERARTLGASHIVVGATAALRSAGNGAEVAAKVEARIGLPVRILSGEEEARLVYRAVVTGLGAAAQRSSCVVFDLGGGSTEVVSGVGERAGRWTSLPFGAVSLTERFAHSNPLSNNDIANISAAVKSELMHSCASMPRETAVLAGVGGTVTVLALLDRGLKTYEPSSIEGWAILPARLKTMVQQIAQMDHDERRGLPAMGEGRADIVVAGCIAVQALVERFPSSGLLCSTQGLRYGLARLAAEEIASGPSGSG